MSEGLFYTMGLNPEGFLAGIHAAEGGVAGFAIKAVNMALPLNAALELAGKLLHLLPNLDDAINLEKSQARLNSFIGDMRVTKALFEQFDELEAKTPFDKLDLAETGRKLIASGTDVQHVGKELDTLATLAGRAHAELDVVSQAILKAREMGQVDPVAFRSLTGEGVVGVHEALAKVRQESGKELEESLNAGRVSADDLLAAFQSLTAEGGRFFNNSAEGSVTLARLITRAEDAWKEFKVVLEMPVVDAIKPMVQTWMDFINGAKEQAQDAIRGIEIVFAQGKLGETLYHTLAYGFDEAVNYGWKVLSGLDAALSPIGNALTDILSNKRMWQDFASIGEGVMMQIGAFLDAALSAAWDGLVGNMSQGMRDLTGAKPTSDQHKANMRDSMMEGGSKIDEASRDLAVISAIAAKHLTNSFSDIGGGFKSGMAGAGNLLDPTAHAQAFLDMMSSGHADLLKERAGDKKALEEHKDAVAGVTATMPKFKGTLEDLMNKLLGAGNAAGGAAAAALRGAMGGVTSTPHGRLNPAQKAVRDFLGMSGEQLKQYQWDPFANGGKGGNRSMDETFARWGKDHPQMMEGARDWLRKQGKNGFNGIKDLTDFVNNQPAGVFANLPGARGLAGGQGNGTTAIERLLDEIRKNTSNLKIH